MIAPANGDVACDHYHRYAEDVALMREIGLKAYRFSFSWPRIFPEGTGKPNARGVKFYHRLIDALLKAGVTPWATLFHWDFPLALYHRGGWLNRDSADWFGDYADFMAREFGDKIRHWITLNEPQCFVGLGHGEGCLAPGLVLPREDVLRVAHHAMMAHGAAVRALRSRLGRKAQIGYAPVGVVKEPLSESPADIAAARKHMFAVGEHFNWTNAWYGDPVVLGRYPEDGLKHHEALLPKGWEKDVKSICEPLDFYGANIYNSEKIRAGKNGRPEIMEYHSGSPLTAFKWVISPSCLRWGPRFLHERYKLPIVITENGVSGADWPQADGSVPDPMRVEFLRQYIRELARGMSEGADVQGYFHWSLLDNFEWAQGYKERFGLVYVDFATGKRTPKASAAFFRDLIRSNREPTRKKS